MKSHNAAYWSSDELATVASLYSSTSAPVLGAKLGRSTKSIYHVAGKLGLQKTTEQIAAIQRIVPKSPEFLQRKFTPTHGMSIEEDGTRSATYTAWRSMRSRCMLPTRRDWPRYGGRGIRVCSQWDSYAVFLSDMGPKPPNTTLGRLNNDGNYEPQNCSWETDVQQARNKCTNVLLHAFGKYQCLAQWSEDYGIRADTLQYRLKHGMATEEALTKPVDKRFKRKVSKA